MIKLHLTFPILMVTTPHVNASGVCVSVSLQDTVHPCHLWSYIGQASLFLMIDECQAS